MSITSKAIVMKETATFPFMGVRRRPGKSFEINRFAS
jgi:hypothetical protein